MPQTAMQTNQRKALRALLACSTIEQAAKQAGLSKRTIYRYLADDSFKTELRALQDRTINAAVAALSGLAGDAIQVLRDALTDDDATMATRVRAAIAVLDQAIKLTELRDLIERVERLEQERDTQK